MVDIKRYSDFTLRNVLLLHGFPESNFYPWLKDILESRGYTVEFPQLPNLENPNVDEQVNYVLENYPAKKNIIIGHSMGGCTAMKLIEKLEYKIDKLVLISAFSDINFPEGDEDIELLADSCDWNFNFENIKNKTEKIYILRPTIDSCVTLEQTKSLSRELDQPIHYFEPQIDHACGESEPNILKFI